MGTTRKMGLRQIELGFSSFYVKTQTQFLGSTCTHSTTSWLVHEFSDLLLPQCLDISTLDKINNYIFQNIFFTSKSSGWTPLILQLYLILSKIITANTKIFEHFRSNIQIETVIICQLMF